MSILSIQSHVAYGYVGNKAAVFPLQTMGYDVWPVNTVQFSNHTGYGKWQGEVFSSAHVKNVIKGIEALGVASKCQAILSGYMGSSDICHAVLEIVQRFKSKSAQVCYLCDPIIGNKSCYVKPEVLIFFKEHLYADIVTPNQFEAEVLSGISITKQDDLKKAADYFHHLGVKIVIITGVKLKTQQAYSLFISYGASKCHLIKTPVYPFDIEPNGTGDLLSALFLGHYLTTQDPLLSLQITAYLLDKVLYNTSLAKSRELRLVGMNYKDFDEKKLAPCLAF